jgi:hypothetical protein
MSVATQDSFSGSGLLHFVRNDGLGFSPVFITLYVWIKKTTALNSMRNYTKREDRIKRNDL